MRRSSHAFHSFWMKKNVSFLCVKMCVGKGIQNWKWHLHNLFLTLFIFKWTITCLSHSIDQICSRVGNGLCEASLLECSAFISQKIIPQNDFPQLFILAASSSSSETILSSGIILCDMSYHHPNFSRFFLNGNVFHRLQVPTYKIKKCQPNV